ncbi:hypothetical protein BDW22DRAFT_1356525 [Trametopsis cervina]|nr:hypothetical protein BDW22DRAFT_1356525 [Trametopsis cervina]
MSGYKTAWSKSSLPSDRLAPSNAKPQSKQVAPAKGKQKESTIPKSRAVRRLEELRDGLAALDGKSPVKDPKGGCFCLAREHELSPYTPICLQCGLILCSVNRPYHACPHCNAALLGTPARLALIDSLDQSIAETLAKEERERIQVIEDARKAAGAFPTLSAAAAGAQGAQDAHPVNQPHKVLSLNSNSKTKKEKVTITSYTQRAPSPMAGIKGAAVEQREPEPTRTPRPPSEVPYASKPPYSDRPWMNVRPMHITVAYIPPPKAAPTSSTRKKGKNTEGGSRPADDNAGSTRQ